MARPRKKLQSRTKLKLERIVRMELLGWSTRQIAAELRMQPASVRELIRHPEYARAREKGIERAYAGVDAEIKRRAGEVLEAAAPDAAAELAALLVSEDEVQRRQAATAILDRSGHGPIRRKAVRQRAELDPNAIRLLQEAMQESNLVLPEGANKCSESTVSGLPLSVEC